MCADVLEVESALVKRELSVGGSEVNFVGTP